ncbi:ABC transporter substrate-binding protein [Streptomyces sp. NPDC007808]|uniref:ABC transporter substrate-binding protein n=1 Tax=Streptomyces sp. NPDC007808 TaxID=3364779 RepID=UPI0036791F5C
MGMPDLTRPAPTRRQLLRASGAAGLALTGLLAGCGTGEADSGGGQTIKVALGWIKNVEFAGYWIAADRGYYADEGLTVEFQAGGPNAPDPTQSVATGNAHIGIHPNLQTVVQAIAKGNDFKLVGTQFQTGPGGMLSLASDPVRTPADLVGKKILGQQGTQPTIDAALKVAGLPKDYTFVPVGFDPAPLVEKKGAVYTCFVTSQPITLEQKYGMKEGTDYVSVTTSDLGIPGYACLVFTGNSFLDKHRKAVEGFLRASVRGWQDNARDPEIAARLAVEKYGVDLGLDLKQQIRENELQTPLTRSALTESSGLFRIDTELLGGKMYEALRASGVQRLPDASEIVDQTVLDAVFKGKSAV